MARIAIDPAGASDELQHMPAPVRDVFARLAEYRSGGSARTIVQAVVNAALLAVPALVEMNTASVLILVPCWLLQGLVLAGCYTAAHDCAHGTFLPNARLNALFGRVWASLALMNYTIYRYYHLRHHAFTGREGDTEAFGWHYESLFGYLRDFLFGGAEFLFGLWLESMRTWLSEDRPAYLPAGRARVLTRIDSIVLNGWIAVLLAATVLAPMLSLKMIWAPYAAYSIAIFVTGLPEHYGTQPGPNALLSTRSVRSNALFRFIYWNGNFHTEHHLFPTVPSNQLAELHRAISGSLVHVDRSLLGFHRRLFGDLIGRPGPAAGER